MVSVMRCWDQSIQPGVWVVLVAAVLAHAQPAQAQLQISAFAADTAAQQGPPPPGQLQAAVAAADATAQSQSSQPKPSTQDSTNPFWRFFTDGEWYFSWGYNKENWTRTDIHVSQPSLGNNFTLYDVQGHDEAGGVGQDLLQADLFGPQYNIRVGRFFTDSFGVEISLDHTKYQTTLNQLAALRGTIGGVSANGNYQLTNQFFNEELHNGANHLMIDGVYRYPLIGKTNETLSVALLAKAGIGIMLPHTSDTILGNSVDVGGKTFGNAIGLNNGWWQLNGWTTGAELGFRVVLYKPVYLEVSDKVAYAYFWDLPAYLGTIQQSLVMNEAIVSIGFTYDGTSPSPWH
jgi:hypothetical protein